MKKIIKPLNIVFLLVLIVILSACNKSAENEHLPGYCQTYSGFAATASPDLYELLAEQDKQITYNSYLTVISTIELEFNVDDANREIDLGGIQCFQNLTSLTLIGQSFKDISEISALSNIQSLELRDTSVVSIDSFKNLSKINSLNISGTHTLQSVEGVGEMTKLTHLSLTNNGIVIIDELDKLVNLVSLDISENQIRVFPSITKLENLTTLNISYNNIYELGDDLSGLSSVQRLNASHNDICDISTMDDLSGLTHLDLSYNNLGCDNSGLSPNFDSLENAINLVELKLDHNDLVSISGLEGRNIALETLYLNDNLLVSISAISEYTSITDLVLSNNNISTITDLSGMTMLTNIDLSYNDITLFDDLLSITTLVEVNLSNNNISTIPEIEDFWPMLDVLDLHSNVLTSTSGVRNHPTLGHLILYNNGLEELSGIKDLPNLSELVIFDEEIELELPILEQNPNQISVIRDSFINLPSEINDVENSFEFGFAVEPNLRIYNSIKGLSTITRIDFSDMQIDYIEDDSIELDNLTTILVNDNNLPNLDFILGNPNLIQVDASNNNINNFAVFNGTLTDDLDYLAELNIQDNSFAVSIEDTFIDLPSLNFVYLNNSNITEISNSFVNLPLFEEASFTNTNVITIDTSFNSLPNFEAITLDSITELTTLTNSLNDLPSLISLNMDLSNGLEDIILSINDLPKLEALGLEPDSLTTIEDSFNDIFSLQANAYSLLFTSGNIGEIVRSFNGGNYTRLFFDNQEPTITDTLIDDSFNSLIMSGSGEIAIFDSNFKTVTNSFKNDTASNISVNNSLVESMTSSFTGSTVTNKLSLSNNLLTTVPSLNTIASVDVVDLSHNRLATLSFIDSIIGITSLDISNQVDTFTNSYTLLSLDGVNNMPTLTDFTYDFIGVTEIQGLIDVGITEFDLSYSTNDNKTITFIHPDSFTNSFITNLDLDGHHLSNFEFLDNFNDLEILFIGIDSASLADFSGLPFESTLERLAISSVQGISDFSYLSSYDTLENLTIDSDSTSSLVNLDGLESLLTLSIDEQNILSIDNSFNDMPNYNPIGLLNLFINLSIIDQSFDMYGTIGHEDTLVLNSGAVSEITDSFNNVNQATIDVSNIVVFTNSFVGATDITIEGNNGNLTPVFDTNSFAQVQSLEMEYGDYDSYVFINAYNGLDTFNIGTLSTNIINLVNDSILEFTIESSLESASTFILDLGIDSIFNLNSQRILPITIDSDAKYYNVEANTTVTIISELTLLDLVLDVNDLILNADNATQVVLNDVTTSTMVLNTNSLNSLTRTNLTPITAAVSVTVNSLEDILDYSVRTPDLVVNNVLATEYTLTVIEGNASINNNQANLLVNFTGNDLKVQYNTLESLVITGDFINLYADSAILSDVQLGTATIGNVFIESSIGALTVDGSDVGNINVTDNNISTFSSNAPTANLNLTTAIATPLTLDIVANEIVVDNSNLATMVIANTSNVNTIDLTAITTLNDLTFGSATLSTIEIDTAENNIDITGSSTVDINIVGPNLTTSSIIASNSSINITTSTIALSGTVDVANLDITSATMTTFTLVSSNISSTLTFEATPVINNVSVQATLFGNLDVTTNSSTITVDAVNALSTVINGANINNLILDLGVNDGEINLSSTSALSIQANADVVDITSNSSIISIDNSSTITDLTVNADNLTNLLAGTANILNMSVNNDVSNIDVTGYNLSTLSVSGSFQNVDISTGLTTDTMVMTSNTAATAVATNTSDLYIFAAGDVVVTSSTLEAIDLNIAGNDTTLNLSKNALTFTLEGTANQATLTGPNIIGINFGALLNVNTLVLDNVNITSIDLSTKDTTSLHITSAETTLEISSNNLTSIVIDAVNLNELTINDNNPVATMELTTSGAALTIIGEVNEATINDNSLTSLTMTGVSINDLTLNTNLLATLNTLNSIDETIDITTNQNNFSLTTNTPSVVFTSTTANTLDVTSTLNGSMVLSTNVDTINFNASNTIFEVEGSSLSTITGTVDRFNTTNTDNTFTINITANNVSYTDNASTAIIVESGSDISNMVINSSTITSVNTNNAIIDSFEYEFVNNSLNLETNSSSIDLISTGTGVADIIYLSSSPLNLNLDSVNTINLTINSANLLVIDGVSVAELNIDSTTLSSINTNNVTVGSLDYTYVNNNITVTTASDDITLNTTGSGDASISYTGPTLLNIDLGIANDIILSLSSASSLDVEGSANSVVVSGTSLNSVSTELLFISSSYQMNNTLIDDLEFVSAGLLNIGVNIEIDTLSNTNISSIIAKIDGTEINLVSPIVDLDIYNYYYNIEYNDLTSQEAIDNIRYDGYRATAVNEAWAQILTISYMSHLNETATKAEIDAQTYQTVEQYFQSYLLEQGETEESLGEIESAAARAAITATLEDPLLTISEVALSNEVIASIEFDADIVALAEQTSITFTLNN